MIRQIKFAAFLVLIAGAIFAPAFAQELQALKSPGGEFTKNDNFRISSKNSRVAWAEPKNTAMFFQPRGGRWADTPKDEIFLEFTFADVCYGKLEVRAIDNLGREIKPDKYTYETLLNSKTWKTAHYRFPNIKKDELKAFRIVLRESWHKADRDATPNPVLAISKATASGEPFANPYFKYLLAESWKYPYKGKTVKPPNNNTLKGKTMAGYQGWFRTPNDPHHDGWIHWGDVPNQRFSVDMWPYMDDYPKGVAEKAHETKTLSGKTAYLFSSARPEVVYTHFLWMKKYNIDGVFLQKFISGDSWANNKREQWVMGNVREAANRTGRIWAIEYDISGCNDDNIFEKISNDWKWCIDEFGLREDPNYARVDGKPVVFVWGMELRGISLEAANKVMNFLKHDPKYGGNYFIGGASGRWKNKPDWIESHFKHHDAVLFWLHQRYAEDIKEVKELLGENIAYYAHIHPGFSWANLKHIQSNSDQAYTPRRNGEFVQGQIARAADAGADMIFIGMFDEYDESTAFMPMSDDPPPTPIQKGARVSFNRSKDAERVPRAYLRPKIEFTFGESPAKDVGPTDFRMQWEASIKIPADGDYTFEIEAPDGDAYELKRGNRQLIRENNHQSSVPPRTTTVSLKKDDMFPVQINYEHRSGGGTMRLVWSSKKIKRQTVPEEYIFDAWGRFITNEDQTPFRYLEICEDAHDLINPKAAYTGAQKAKRPKKRPTPARKKSGENRNKKAKKL
ncbi:MAG: hypothetical protein IKS15_03895 [Opitutales bacterium]|nr:hypothetical protein [Opitutales bacterium]